MSTGSDLLAAVTQAQADVAKLHAWLHGPASGDGSIVDFGDGLLVKTPARLAAENAVYDTPVELAIDEEGAVAIDLSLGSVFVLPLTADVDMTITGVPAGTAASFVLETIGDDTQRTITEPASVVAMNGAWTPTATDTRRDRALYDTIDGGTTWRRWVEFQNA
jgi:hypothetical protein